MTKISPLSLVRNTEVDEHAPSVEVLQQRVAQGVQAAAASVQTLASAQTLSYRQAEREISDAVFAIGRALIVLLLGLREAHVMAAHHAAHGTRYQGLFRTLRSAPPIARNLTTVFGVVRYFRSYLREVNKSDRRGVHPVDVSLGLTADRISWNVLMVAARLATKMAFVEARTTLSAFMPDAPSTEVIEKTVLGLGRHVAEFVEQAPAPQDDGEVLIIQVDGKGAPTATERELARRRKKRGRAGPCRSPRHRGRARRRRHPRQPRRSKGDKAKNAKMATMIVMYTLRRVGTAGRHPQDRSGQQRAPRALGKSAAVHRASPAPHPLRRAATARPRDRNRQRRRRRQAHHRPALRSRRHALDPPACRGRRATALP